MEWWERLDGARKDQGMSVAELARRSGIPVAKLRKWLAGEVEKPRGEDQERAAKVFGHNIVWLLHGIDVKDEVRQDDHAAIRLRPIAIVSILDVLKFGGDASVLKSLETTARVAIQSVGERAFGVRVSDNAMSPMLIPDDVAIVDPDEKAIPGKIVCVMMDEDPRRIVFRRYRLISSGRTPEVELIAENRDFPSERLGKGRRGKIIGRVVHIVRVA